MVEEKRKPPKLPSKVSKGTAPVSSQTRRTSTVPESIASTSKGQPAEDVPKRKAPKLGPPKSTGPALPKQEQSKRSSTVQDNPAAKSNKPAKLGPRRSDSTQGPPSSMSKRPSLASTQRPSAASRSSLALSSASKQGLPNKSVRSKSPAGRSTVSVSTENSKSVKTRPGPSSRQPSIASGRPQPRKLGPKATPTSKILDVDEVPAHKVAEEERDLKSFMNASQCAELTLLIANITGKMRGSIESNFDASSGLKLLGKDTSHQDVFENLDYDPGTVDVSEYDKERKIREEQEKSLLTPEVKDLKKAALEWFDEWREVVLLRVGEAVNSKQIASEQKDGVRPKPSALEAQPVQKIDASVEPKMPSGPKLEDLFPRTKTSLTKLPMRERVLVLHSILLLLLSLENYNAASRVLLLYLTSSLKLGINALQGDEERTAQGLLEAAKQMTADSETGKRLEEANKSRIWKIRLATAAGAAVIGYTGGLAAPMISAGVGSLMGEIGLGATAAAGYLGSVAGSTTLVGGLFGAYGARMTGQMMSNLSAGVQDFAFLPIHGERKEHEYSVKAATDTRRLRVIIAISGWLLEKEEVVTPWRVLKPSAEVFALRYELEALMNLGQSIDTMLQSTVYGYAQSQLVKRTVFADLMSAMWPVALVKVARVVDNPFSVARARAEKAGEVLADALINKVQGERPVTLVAYSLGARVIWSCLNSLAKRKAFGLVESAVLMGSPIPSDASAWRKMRTVVSGRLVNVYSANDYLLAFLYRTSSLQYGVAGLMPVSNLAGIENVDVSEIVSGHLRYRYLVGSILQKIRFEDVDKEEVAKEAKAFEALVEEEKKRTYVRQAGELYENYKGKKPQPRKLGPRVPQAGVKDVDSENEASAMEKLVREKTKSGLMRWAVEQLYLSRPSTGTAMKAASDPQGATKDSINDAKKTSDAATKSLYQRAKEATYLSRSGGPQGKLAAQEKQADAQVTAKSVPSKSYLSHAAGYIPTGYIPGFRSATDAAQPAAKTPMKAKEVPRRPSALTKEQSGTKGSKSNLKKADGAPQRPSGSAKDDGKMAANVQKGAEAAMERPPEILDECPKAPKTGSGESGDTQNNGAQDAESTTRQMTGGAQRAAETTGDALNAVRDVTRGANELKRTVGGYTNYIPSFGYGTSGSKEPPNEEEKPVDANEDDEKLADREDEKGTQKEASGYGSYIPSFAFGGSTSKKGKEKGKEGERKEGEGREDEGTEGEGGDEGPEKEAEVEAEAEHEAAEEAGKAVAEEGSQIAPEKELEREPVVEPTEELKNGATREEEEGQESEQSAKDQGNSEIFTKDSDSPKGYHDTSQEMPANRDVDGSENKGKGQGKERASEDPFTSPPSKGERDSPFTSAARAAAGGGEGMKYPWEKTID